MEIRFSRGILRPWHLDDAPSLVAQANNRNIWRNMRDGFPHPYTTADADRWLVVANKYDPPQNFAIILQGNAVGGIGLLLKEDVYHRSAEVGYWLGEAFWGQGIMSEVLPLLVDYAFSRFDICRMYAGIFAWNPASGRVLEKAGFQREARLRSAVTKDGATTDELIYALIRNSG